MKELLDLANELKNEYPEHEKTIDAIVDECLSYMEAGENKSRAISRAKKTLKILTKEDE